jgi:hypothetical protein
MHLGVGHWTLNIGNFVFMEVTRKTWPWALCLVSLFATTGSCGVASPQNQHTRQTKNPIADFFRIQLNNNTAFGIGPHERTREALNCQLLTPVFITRSLRFVPRTLLSMAYQSDPARPEGGAFGLGDFRETLYLAYLPNENLICAAGPVFAFPTATAKLLGTGKWLMGPDAAAVIALPPSWSFSMEIANLWSFAGDSHRMQINSFFARPSAGYAFLFAKKLYLFTAPAFEANWVSPADRWIVPVGGGIGFPFNIYKLAIDISTQSYWIALHPQGSADWILQFRLQAAFT